MNRNEDGLLQAAGTLARPPGRRRSGRCGQWCLAFLALLLSPLLLAAAETVLITEFMAANVTALNDEDGENSDWIEVHNEGAAAANLAGWYLTDSANNLRQWQFPSTHVPANGYLVVFASGKNRRAAGAPLHTNFKLSSGGEYLALVQPDGTNVVSEFSPLFPPQADDVAYGLIRPMAQTTLVNTGAAVRVHVPRDGALGLSWTAVEFNDDTWIEGTTGVGYDVQTVGVNFLPWLGLNVESLVYKVNPTLYARLKFTVANPETFSGLILRLCFEDGVIAYLNGTEVASSNAPATPAWNSTALGPRTDTAATNWLDLDISDDRGFLVAGINVLSFHALNVPVSSPDLLLMPQLVGATPMGSPVPRYFPVPTPGQANNQGVVSLGPLIIDPDHHPTLPADADTIAVTARLRALLFPIASVTLRYRVMFGSETALPMADDGAHGDGAAGDGVYGATVPAEASLPGQMVRWYVTATDTTGTNTSRLPPFTSTNDSPAYLGTVLADPSATGNLPVFHWFVQNPAAADTRTGTHCSVFYAGEFYDNVFCRVRGASAATYLKKPYKFDFNPGYHFRLLPGVPRMDELNLNANYQDKAHLRQALTFETYRNAEVPASDAFNVRVQQNGVFFSVAVAVEQLDRTFLERRSLDPNGALYKIFNGIDSAVTGVRKQTRRSENNSDLQQLVTAVNRSNPNRGTLLFDLLNLPEIINYLAAGTIAQDWDRAIKNLYLYRDTEGTGLWQMLPWDKDLSFGKVGLLNDTLTANRDGAPQSGGGEPYVSHPFYGEAEHNCCGVNHLIDAIYKTPLTRAMYVRRVRTLMDQMLQPPETPASELLFETRVNDLLGLLEPDAALDLGRWPVGYGQLQNLATAVSLLKSNYLAPRRVHLYQTQSIDNVGHYSQAVGIPHAQVGSPPLQFGLLEYSPASHNQAQEYVELLNPNPVAVDISGWRLDGGIRFTFAPGTVVPANGRVYVSPDVAAFLIRPSGPRGGQGLFVVGNSSGQLSARGETLCLLDASGQGVATNTYPGGPSLAQQFLRVVELMYHPAPPPPGSTNSPEDFEFLELKNVSTNVTLDLGGVRLVGGVDFDFAGGAGPTLGPGASLLVGRNLAALTARYGPGLPLAGTYIGALENTGERLRLLDAEGEEILDFTYEDAWYPVTDGLGLSLVIVDEHADPDAWADPGNWRPGGLVNGSPGESNPPPPLAARVVVNEVLSRTDSPPPTDSVELFNPTADPVNIGGWFLSDDLKAPGKFRIPEGTTLAGGAFVVFTEADFNAGGLGFAFRSLGDEVWLFSGDAQSNLTGYVHGFRFGAAEDGVSFGRHVTSEGTEQFVAQLGRTLGGTNAGPRTGPIVISEIMYHPVLPAERLRLDPWLLLLGDQTAGDLSETIEGSLEFIELENITSNPVSLFDSRYPANTWRIRGGVDYDFPRDLTVPPGGRLLLVGFNPASDAWSLETFLATYGLAPTVPLLGPWNGQLDNAGERLELDKPEAPEAGTVPYVLADAVEYRDTAPWPEAADGLGSSLQKIPVADYGNEPTHWFAAGRTPGASNVFNQPPAIAILSPTNDAVLGQGATLPITVEANDTDGTLGPVELFSGLTKIGEVLSAPYIFDWTSVPFGIHLLTARVRDDRGALSVSAAVKITVLAQPPAVALTSPTDGAVVLASGPIALTAAASDADGFIAKVEFYDGPAKLGEATAAPFLFLWTNAAVGTHTLTAAAIDNADNRVLSAPVEVIAVAGFTLDLALVAPGAAWKYWDNGLDLGTAWRTNDYSDNSWPSGPAPLGYGDGDETTVVGYGPNANTKYITTYFRRSFVVDGAAAFSRLEVRVLRDDGAVVHLNGTEAFRTGMPDGPIGFNTLANITVVEGDESTNFFGASLDPGLLIEGTNVLALEVHQVLATSSDISFDLELSGSQTFFAPYITAQPASQSAVVGSNVTFRVEVLGTPPLAFQWRFNGVPLEGARDSILTLGNVQSTQGGSYTVQVTNTVGSVTSLSALLGVLAADDYAQAVAADGPIHYYRFEESSTAQAALDSGVPGGRNGLFTGGITLRQSTAPLRLGQAARFNGAPGTLVNLGLFHPGNAMTVEAWVQLDADAGGGTWHAIVARWDGSYELDIATDERPNLVIRNQASAFGLVAGPTAVPRQAWTHLVGVYDAGTLSLYLNGQSVASSPLAGTLRNGGPTPDRVLIGATRDGSTSSFNWKGLIDEVAIYDRALPPERILAHYYAALPASRLAINHTGELSWPALPANLVVQAAQSLREPVQWQDDSIQTSTVDGYRRGTISLSGTNRFYRLIQR